MIPVTRVEEEQHNWQDPKIKWMNVTESFVKDGVTYTRSWSEGPFYHDEQRSHFTTANDDQHTIGVLCGDCQGDAFNLCYGSYEILATCVACGKAATVYEG